MSTGVRFDLPFPDPNDFLAAWFKRWSLPIAVPGVVILWLECLQGTMPTPAGMLDYGLFFSPAVRSALP